jgi:hypothetical protein
MERALKAVVRRSALLALEVVMKPRLRAILVLCPEPEARRELDAALDTLADAIAERIVSRARAQALAGCAPSSRVGPGSGALADSTAEGQGR